MGKIRQTRQVLYGLSLVIAVGCGKSNAPSNSGPDGWTPKAPLAQGQLQFFTDFQQGCQAARLQGKPVLIFFTAPWCHFCHEMARDAFTNQQVVNLSERFVCILVDADSAPALCRAYGVRGFPTIQFLAPGGTPLQQVVGKRASYELINQMHTALQASSTAVINSARRPVVASMITRG